MKAVICAIMAFMVFAGCVQNEQPVQLLDENYATAQDVSDVVNGNSQFAIDAYKKLNSENGGKNIFFSPYSISSALAITYEGARGQTAQEMQQVLGLPEDENAMLAGFAKIYNTINGKGKSYQLYTANALWAQQSYKFLDSFTSVSKKYFGAQATNVDFINKSEQARQEINGWVESHTNSKIKDLMPQGSLDPLTRLVITNAVYFKGKWKLQFEPSKTYGADFKVSPQQSVKVQMMHMSGEKSRFNYLENDELQMIELPYDGNGLSMVVILPLEGKMDDVEQSLSVQKIGELKAMLSEQEVVVNLPKFKFKTKYSMAQTLAGMGMPNAFSDEADFSGMDGTKDLYISKVIHQAFVEVNEEGTEAAAATAVVDATSIAQPQNIFNANRPFIFMIEEKSTGTILFMGKVTDPSKAD